MKTNNPLPNWIETNFSPSDLAAVNQGGCASGAYMPAVTYATALTTMNEYGDEILEFLLDGADELPQHINLDSWGSIAVFYLSTAVELWCALNSELADWDNENPIRGCGDE